MAYFLPVGIVATHHVHTVCKFSPKYNFTFLTSSTGFNCFQSPDFAEVSIFVEKEKKNTLFWSVLS